jgi:hypothetical protein
MAQKSTRRPSKVYDVPLGKMRVPPALVTQRQFRKAHGDKLAAELDLNKLGLPVLNHRDGVFWVLDGQHRLYALKQFGFSDNDVLPCEVYEQLSDAEMADIFLGRDDRRAVSPYDKFHVSCTAGHRRELDIRRAVESNGLVVGQVREENTVSAVGALGKVYDKAGESVLGKTLRTLRKAYNGDPTAFDRAMIEGLGLTFHRYNGKINDGEMVEALGSNTVRSLLRRAEAQRERTGNQQAQCVASAIVDLYNKGRGPRDGKRLTPWWREDEPTYDDKKK